MMEGAGRSWREVARGRRCCTEVEGGGCRGGRGRWWEVEGGGMIWGDVEGSGGRFHRKDSREAFDEVGTD